MRVRVVVGEMNVMNFMVLMVMRVVMLSGWIIWRGRFCRFFILLMRVVSIWLWLVEFRLVGESGVR